MNSSYRLLNSKEPASNQLTSCLRWSNKNWINITARALFLMASHAHPNKYTTQNSSSPNLKPRTTTLSLWTSKSQQKYRICVCDTVESAPNAAIQKISCYIQQKNLVMTRKKKNTLCTVTRTAVRWYV